MIQKMLGKIPVEARRIYRFAHEDSSQRESLFQTPFPLNGRIPSIDDPPEAVPSTMKPYAKEHFTNEYKYFINRPPFCHSTLR